MDPNGGEPRGFYNLQPESLQMQVSGHRHHARGEVVPEVEYTNAVRNGYIVGCQICEAHIHSQRCYGYNGQNGVWNQYYVDPAPGNYLPAPSVTYPENSYGRPSASAQSNYVEQPVYPPGHSYYESHGSSSVSNSLAPFQPTHMPAQYEPMAVVTQPVAYGQGWNVLPQSTRWKSQFWASHYHPLESAESDEPGEMEELCLHEPEESDEPVPKRARTDKPKEGTTSKNKVQWVNEGEKNPRPRRNGPLEPEARKLAAIKRVKKLVCVRCHWRKEGCTVNPDEPDGPCGGCSIREAPCIRYRILDSSLYRGQTAPYSMFSQRWKSMDLIDIDSWAGDEVKTIELSLMCFHAPYRVKVREFVPQPGDMLGEKWTKDGQLVHFPLPRYGIVNMRAAAESIGWMIETQTGNLLTATVGDPRENSLIWTTYQAAFERAGSPSAELEEQRLLFDVFRLWTACRLTSHHEHIVGEEKLGTLRVDDPASPHWGSFPICPVLTAQLECIYYSRFLGPLSAHILKRLKRLMEGSNRRYWFTVYLAMFIMLHSCSLMTRRDREYASLINLSDTYCNPVGIKQHHVGSKTLLAYFHLGMKGSEPFDTALKGIPPSKSDLATLKPKEVSFVKVSAQEAVVLKPHWDRIRKSGAMDHDFYWISQLFDQDWKPEKMD